MAQRLHHGEGGIGVVLQLLIGGAERELPDIVQEMGLFQLAVEFVCLSGEAVVEEGALFGRTVGGDQVILIVYIDVDFADIIVGGGNGGKLIGNRGSGYIAVLQVLLRETDQRSDIRGGLERAVYAAAGAQRFVQQGGAVIERFGEYVDVSVDEAGLHIGNEHCVQQCHDQHDGQQRVKSAVENLSVAAFGWHEQTRPYIGFTSEA